MAGSDRATGDYKQNAPIWLGASTPGGRSVAVRLCSRLCCSSSAFLCRRMPHGNASCCDAALDPPEAPVQLGTPPHPLVRWEWQTDQTEYTPYDAAASAALEAAFQSNNTALPVQLHINGQHFFVDLVRMRQPNPLSHGERAVRRVAVGEPGWKDVPHVLTSQLVPRRACEG